MYFAREVELTLDGQVGGMSPYAPAVDARPLDMAIPENSPYLVVGNTRFTRRGKEAHVPKPSEWQSTNFPTGGIWDES